MQKMENKRRLLGIDLCRGLAAFAVIVVHSGDETWGVPVSYWALQFRLFFYFAVPFFLAVSFFFTTQNLSKNISFQFWKTKFQRIIIPYVVWSIFYLVFGTTFSLITHQSDRINAWREDPISIIFFGSASYHLYFLPLLFSGTLLVFLLTNLIKRRNGIKIIVVLSIVSIIFNEIITLSGNSFQLNPPVAFTSLLNLIDPNSIEYQIARFFLMQVAWMLKCLPYLCIAIILNNLILRVNPSIFKNRSAVFLFFTIFIFANTFRARFIISELSPIIIAFSLLIFGICLSNYLKENNIIISLGNCSFGIYLIHPVLKRIITSILSFAIPQLAIKVTVFSILCFSITTFLVSWLVVLILMQNKQVAKYMFGN